MMMIDDQPRRQSLPRRDVGAVEVQRHLRRDAIVPDRVVLLDHLLRLGGDAGEGGQGRRGASEGDGRGGILLLGERCCGSARGRDERPGGRAGQSGAGDDADAHDGGDES